MSIISISMDSTSEKFLHLTDFLNIIYSYYFKKYKVLHSKRHINTGTLHE